MGQGQESSSPSPSSHTSYHDYSSGISKLMKQPWSKWSNAAVNASENFFNYPAALFNEDEKQCGHQIPQPQHKSKSKPKAATEKFFNYPAALFAGKEKQDGERDNNKPQPPRQNSAAVPPKACNAKKNKGAPGDEPSTLPTAVKGSTAERGFFSFPSALLGEPKLPKVSGTLRNTRFFNFPSALFRQEEESGGDSTRNSNHRDDESTNLAEKRLSELENTIDEIESKKKSKSNKNEKHSADVSEAITQACLLLDAIEISRTEITLRTKRKELLRRAEALDPASSASLPASSLFEEDPREGTANIAPTPPPSPDIVSAEARFDAIEREIIALEKELTKTTFKADRNTVAEFVTQLCCKLDGVDIAIGSSKCSNAISLLKARRKDLLKRAETIEEIAFRVES